MEAEDRGSEGSGSGFRWLILSTIFTTYSLIVLGGVVRATESGDACPDWPRCHGELIPPFETAVLIEFSHRLLASVVGFLILAVLIVAWRTYRNNHAIVWGSALALVLVTGQAILGGVTVLNELPANLVTAHLALASALLALLLFAIIFLWTPPHFWALAQRYRADYAKASVPMLPVVSSENETNRQILIYSVVLVAATLVIVPVASMGILYAAAALVLGAGFVAFAMRLWRTPGGRASMALFVYSLPYLGLLFVSADADQFVQF